jgi:hypothetical protein
MPQSPSLRTDPFFTIFIKHIPSSEVVSFEGWVTEFSDQFSSNWNQQSVYGRMDPLATFENTQRTITLGFDVVSDNINDAAANLANINYLIEFLYPMYQSNERGVQNTLKAAPLLGMKWTNLINNSSPSGYLYGYINGGLNYAPDIGEGGFIIKSENVFRDLSAGRIPESTLVGGARAEGGVTNVNKRPTLDVGDGSFQRRTPGGESASGLYTINGKESTFVPKKVSLSFTFNVLHTHLTGWQKDPDPAFGNSLSRQFPNAVYVVQDQKTVLTSDGEVTAEIDQEAANQALVLGGE